MFNNYAIVQGVDQIVPGRRVRAGLPARARDADPRDPHAAREDPRRRAHPPPARRRARPARRAASTASPRRSPSPSTSGPLTMADDAAPSTRRGRRRRAAEPSPSCVHGVPVTCERRPAGAAPRPRASCVDVVRTLRDDDGFDMCLDVAAVDYLTYEADRGAARRHRARALRGRRHLISHDRPRARCGCGCRCRPTTPPCPSLFDVHPGTEALEREVYDMFGIALRRPPRPHPHPHARGLGRPPAAQGLRHRPHPGAVQGARRTPDDRRRPTAAPASRRPRARRR